MCEAESPESEEQEDAKSVEKSVTVIEWVWAKLKSFFVSKDDDSDVYPLA